MQIELTESEANLVREVLKQEYQDVREQIYKADSSHYKDQLRERETLLEALVAKLGG